MLPCGISHSLHEGQVGMSAGGWHFNEETGMDEAIIEGRIKYLESNNQTRVTGTYIGQGQYQQKDE